MKLSPNAIVPLILSALLAVFCVGCAVMTIDVDVYKGPLVNHQDVQIEQMAARAIGAKPLLVQLRNTLEQLSDPSYSPSRRESNIPQPAYEFTSQFAIRVDEVIGLYDDQDESLNPRLRLVLDEAELFLLAYKESYGTFRPSDLELAQSKWDSISKGFYKFLRTNAVSDIPADHPALTGLPPGADRAFVVGQIQDLQAGYEELLTQARLDKRPIKQILNNHIKIQHSLKDVADNLAQIKNISVIDVIDAETVEAASSNALYSLSARIDVIRAHAELLFPPQEQELREEFERRAIAATNAFIDARSALEGLLVATLKSIVVINTEYLPFVTDEQTRTHLAAGIAVELIEEAHILAVLHLLNSTVDGQSKALFHEFDAKVSHVKEWFLHNLPEALNPEFDRYWRSTNGVRLLRKSYQHSGDPQARILFKNTLRRLLETKPIQTAEALLHAHHVFIESDNFGSKDVVSDCGLLNRYQKIPARRFGLAIGPVLDFDLSLNSDAGGPTKKKAAIYLRNMEFMKYIDEFIGKGKDYARAMRQTSIGRGRLIPGIESLIEKYVDAAYINPSSRTGDHTRTERDRLTNALVRFAEKILFIANNSNLLTQGSSDTHSKQEIKETLRPYTMIFQAIGNSILIQADELRHREDKDKSLTDTKMRERQALYHAYPHQPTMPETDKINSKTSKDVLDELIAVLRYQHIKATREFGKDHRHTTNIAAALKLAYDQRADMVYIRPSSAYLRSSYPATTLQGNSGQAWQNMLFQHGLRQTPLFGELFAKGDESHRRDLELQQEIDKQFWQNINRVRVAGTGDTNYVIAKDDIGNWYVKSYSADPKSIIKSARNLAMFNLGPELGATALERLSGKGETSKDQRLTWRERQLVNYRTKFDAQTLQQHNELKQQADDLPATIEARWQEVLGKDAVTEELTDALKEAKRALDNVEDPRDPKNDPNLGQIVVDRLRAILRFHRALASRLAAIQSRHRNSQVSNERKIEELRSAVENAEIALTEARVRREERKQTHKMAFDLKQIRDVDGVSQQTRDQVKADELQAKIDLDNAESIVTKREEELDKAQNSLKDDQEKLKSEIVILDAKIARAEKAGAEAAKILYGVVSRFAKRRSASVNEYETAITVLGGDGE